MPWRFVTVSGVCLGLLLAPACAEHLPGDRFSWMEQFTGQGGQRCCSALDCQPATVALLEPGDRESLVQIGETTLSLPASWVHPSQDPHGQGWVCYRHDPTPGTLYQDAEGRTRALPPARWTRETVRCAFYVTLN